MDKKIAVKFATGIGLVAISFVASYINGSFPPKAKMSFAEAQSILIDLDVKLSRCNGDGGVFLRSDGIARSGRFLNSEDETRRELAKARAIIICYGKLNTLSYDTNILLKKQWVKMPVAKGEYEYTESDCYAQKNLTFCIYTSDESPLQLSFKDGIGLAELR